MDEVINKISELLANGGKDWEWVLVKVQKYFIEKEAKAARFRAYYASNKERLNRYHTAYRRKHPEYEERRRERARLKRAKPTE